MESFQRLPAELKAVHVIGLGFIAVAIALLIAPAAYHRIAERGEQSERFHRIATRLLLLAMAALAPGLAAAVWMVFEIVTARRWAGTLAASLVMGLFYGAWFGWTAMVRNRRARIQSVVRPSPRSHDVA